MGLKSGMTAAAKSGVPVAAVQLGPRHGKFYINSQGHKVYGEPPSSSTRAEAHAPARPAPAAPGGVLQKPKSMKDMYSPGDKVHVEVAEGVWKNGTVHKALKNHAVVELHDGSWVHSFHDTTKKAGAEPAHAPPPAHVAPPPVHPPAYSPPPAHHPVKATSVDMSKIAMHVGGSPEFKADVERAVLKLGLAHFLEQRPLNLLDEKPLKPGVGGVYIPVLSPSKPNLFIKPGQEEAKKDLPLHHQVGPQARTVTHPSASVRESTLAHELAHHIQLHSEVKNTSDWGKGKFPFEAAPYAKDWTNRARAHVSEVREKTKAGVPPTAWVPSLYARTSTSEWFAEAHTAYVYHRETFKKMDPVGFALVQERRKMEGLHD